MPSLTGRETEAQSLPLQPWEAPHCVQQFLNLAELTTRTLRQPCQGNCPLAWF